jgi:phosphate transport system substrate-binding protein
MPRISSKAGHTALLAAICACAPISEIPDRAQTPASASTIRIWGHGHRGQDYIQTLLTAWQNGFRKTHPAVVFDDQLYGNASAIGGLFTGTADLAIMDREASFIELDAYEQGAGHKLFGVPVALGSVDLPHHAPALVVYVNPRNPLSQLSLRQLDALFDADHRRGDRTYRTWGELGLTGAWASRPIHLYTYEIESAEVQFFERAALKGSQKFNCNLTLLGATPHENAATRIRAAVLKDPDGMALLAGSSLGLKLVPLSGGNGAAIPTAASISSGQYPLARPVYIYLNRRPNGPIAAEVAAFVAYILSEEGQATAARTGGYLPLSPQLLAQAREALQ